MRLLELKFSALGPFPNEHTIDFTGFEASGIYLLRGNTGTGKSTIIDAITYALYGEVAGQNTSSNSRLRSTYADPDTKTLVQLRFETPHGVFEVVRTPAYHKPGRKSLTPASSFLSKLTLVDGQVVGRETLASRKREVDEQVAHVVGLGLDQFLQTVILPQGKFAQFIRASSLQRKELLADIFRTRSFETFTKLLLDKAHEANRQTQQRADRLVTLAAHIHDGEDAELAQALEKEDFDAAHKRLGDHQEQLEIAAQARATAREQARENYREAAFTLEQVRALQRSRARADELERELHSLRARETEIEQCRQTLNRARTARAIVPHIEQAKAAQSELTRANTHLSSVHSKLASAPHLADLPAFKTSGEKGTQTSAALLDAVGKYARECAEERGDDLHANDGENGHSLLELGQAENATEAELPNSETLDPLYQSFAQELTRLEDAAEHEAQLEQLRERLADAREQAERRREQMQADQRELDDIPPQIEQIKTQMEQARTESEAIEQREAKRNQLDDRLRAAREVQELIPQLQDAADEVSRTAHEDDRARQAYEQLRNKWLADSALALSGYLKDGLPCPVCGATEHPAPVTGERLVVSPQDLQEAADASSKATSAFGKARSEHEQITKRIADLNQVAGDSATALEQARGRAQELWEAARKAGTQLATLSEELTRITGKQERLTDRRVHHAEQLEALAQRVTEISQGIAENEAAVRGARGPFDSVCAHIDAVRLAGQQVRDLQRAIDEVHHGQQSFENASAQMRRAVAESIFDTAKSVQEASLTTADSEELEARINEFELNVRACTQELDQLETSGVRECVLPDSQALARVAQACKDKQEAAQDAAATAADRAHRGAAELQSWRCEWQALRRELAQTQTVRLFSRIANGDTSDAGNRVPLATWVLLNQFDDVLAAANPFLARFSADRYALARVESDPGSRSSKVGLGLAIHDYNTDTDRAPLSLSGGETFYTSLALALGLAEVVSSAAGGVEFQSMIIDEGFGSLDAYTRDLVMSGLEAIRDSGRTVGLVSHVEQMQERIADGIHVMRAPGQRYSTLKVYA